MGADDRAAILGADGSREGAGINGVGSPAEGAEALEDLGRVFLLVEVDGQEGIVLVEVQRRRLARAEEDGDVLHLDKRHRRLLELDAGGRYGKVDEPASVVSIWDQLLDICRATRTCREQRHL